MPRYGSHTYRPGLNHATGMSAPTVVYLPATEARCPWTGMTAHEEAEARFFEDMADADRARERAA